MPKTFIIAEIGILHEGSVGLAKKMIEAAKNCGADAVKTQTHIFEAESLPNAPRPYYFTEESRESYFKRTAFSLGQYQELKQYSENLGLKFIVSAFSVEAIDLLVEVGVDIIKVPSGEVNNLPYLEYLARTGKKVLLPSGMSYWEELDLAVKTLKDNGCSDLTVMQCTSEYPCPPQKAGLNIIMELKKRYGLPVGFSDHTMSLSIPAAAVLLGACVVEKHLTLSHLMYGADAKNSLEPQEFKRMVEGIREVEKAMTIIDKDAITEGLGDMKHIFEKSVVAAYDLPSGIIISPEHLAFKKPGDGIKAKEYKRVIGRILNGPVAKDHKFIWENFLK